MSDDGRAKALSDALLEALDVELVLEVHVMHVKAIGLACKCQGSIPPGHHDDVAAILRKLADEIEASAGVPMHTDS